MFSYKSFNFFCVTLSTFLCWYKYGNNIKDEHQKYKQITPNTNFHQKQKIRVTY